MDRSGNEVENKKIDEPSAKDKLLAAAKKLMAENGYKGTTTKMIARSAGVNEITLFRHFENKEGILNALGSEMAEYGTQAIEDVLNGTYSTVEELLFDFGMAFYQGLDVYKEIFLITIIESEKRPDFVLASSLKLYKMIALLENKLAGLYQEGKLRQCDFSVAALIYVQALIGSFMLQNRFSRGQSSVDISRLCKNSAEILFNGLKPE